MEEKIGHVSLDEQRRGSVPVKDVVFAKHAADDEHNLGFREAVRRYPKAVMWSVLVSMAIISE